LAKLADVVAIAVVVVAVAHVGLIYFLAICVKNNNFKIQKMFLNEKCP